MARNPASVLPRVGVIVQSFRPGSAAFAGTLAAMLLVAAAGWQDGGGATGGGGGGAAPPEIAQEKSPARPDRRNPRQIRRDQGASEGPTMVAGGMPLQDDQLEQYARLEPLVGEFTFTGRNWFRPDAEPRSFQGAWRNEWALDGWYLRMEFTIEGRRPSTSVGMLCYEQRASRWEADFYSSSGTVRTRRTGNFDEETHRVLTMMARSSSRAESDPADQKMVIEIIDDDTFTYTGWVLNRETGEWWKNFTLTAKRVEPGATEASPGGGASAAGGG
ncbi:MAG: DUF1579 family protein [Phycisphaeraceae bacterium]|nr:DUF1579 family protein [Phycisphaerales bacterium]QOJ17634.1 MAG: DUF1579 family protein [Phycisphaeraceae bacterium]